MWADARCVSTTLGGVGGVTAAFKNQPRDQFGTRIPFRGEASGKTALDLLATVGNVLRNAFIRAYLPRVEGGFESEDIEFEAPDFIDLLAAGGIL